jgi:uncharacterized membrane protein
MWWNHGYGWGWPVFLVIAVVCVAMMAGMMRHGGWARTQRTSSRDEDAPERILARRLASGEIDVQEFERLRDALGRTGNSAPESAEPGRAEQHWPSA